MSVPTIFISHAYKDKIIVDAFVNLLVRAGIDECQIVASSTPGTQIHTGKPLYGEIRNTLSRDNVFVTYMLSENYYASKVCLNEMGAAWIMNAPFEVILLPGFSFDQVEGVICEKNLVGISLNNYDPAVVERFAHLREDLTDFGFSLSSEKWNLALLYLYKAVEDYKAAQVPMDPLSMKNSQSFCIGDNDHYGCLIVGTESSENKVTVNIDFSRTTSTLCSVAFFTQVDDWTPYWKKKMHLCFEICTAVTDMLGEVELHMAKGRKISIPVYIPTAGCSYQIPLSQFASSSELWQEVSQVCFLFRKDKTGSNTKVVIENLRLE